MNKLELNRKALRLAATLGLAVLFLLVLLWAASAATTISPFSEHIVTALNNGDVDGQWIRTSTAPTATWYVHPGGSDSDSGTLGLPFATIQLFNGVFLLSILMGEYLLKNRIFLEADS